MTIRLLTIVVFDHSRVSTCEILYYYYFVCTKQSMFSKITCSNDKYRVNTVKLATNSIKERILIYTQSQSNLTLSYLITTNISTFSLCLLRPPD